jgi:long-chain fatty acid transport protein
MVNYGLVDKKVALGYHAGVFSWKCAAKRRGKMRKICITVAAIATCAAAVSVFASGIDNKTNWSAGYARTLNRNAVYDSPDAAVYNPAGIGIMESGLYTSINNQSLFIDYSHESATKTYSAKNPTNFLPSAFVVYKRKMLGFYGAFYVPAGGGSLEYDDGIVDLNETLALNSFIPSADLFGVYYAGTAGVVLSLKKLAAVSLGGRYISGKQTRKFETEATIAGLPGPLAFLNGYDVLLDTEATASGFGAIIGVDLSPVSGLNIGARYETVTKLEWEYTKADGPIAVAQAIAEGNTFNRDLPAMLGVGVSYMVFPKLKVEGSLDYYFNKGADWDGLEDEVDNGFAIGAAAEYALVEKLKVSAGFLYTKTGDGSDSYVYLNPALDSITLAGGAIFQITEKLSAEFGIIKPFYFDDEASSAFPPTVTVDVDKSLVILAPGLQYKIF